MSGATIYFGGRSGTTDENGSAVLDYGGLAFTKYVLVTRAGFEPKIYELPVSDLQIRLSVAESVVSEVPTWWGKHHDAVLLATVFIPVSAFLCWLTYLARRALALRK